MAEFHWDRKVSKALAEHPQHRPKWYPQCADDLNKCTDLFDDVAPEFDPKHPGYNDEPYKARRKDIVNTSNTFKIGGEIPTVEYTPEETELWCKVYTALREMHPKCACKGYNDGMKELEEAGLMRPDKIPQVRDLSAFLQSKTGWQLRPIGGYVEPRDFLAHLAYKYFPCTQYIRHPRNVHYSPDPDGIHDMVGHLPMLINQELADLTQKIGEISLGASDDMIKKLTSLYWFTVEVGLTKENGENKIYGAAVLSSCAEMEFALSGRVPLVGFCPEDASTRIFDPTSYQEVYYTADSISTAMEQLSEFGAKYQ
jgi:phenylalanine-4-hydroxylase